MVINFLIKEPDKFFSDGIILMYQVEELPLLKLFLEQVLLMLLENSLTNTDHLQFMCHHQHGETIMPYLQYVDLQ